jgi:hypothetical protein
MRECDDASCFKPCGEKKKYVKKSLVHSRILHRRKSGLEPIIIWSG